MAADATLVIIDDATEVIIDEATDVIMDDATDVIIAADSPDIMSAPTMVVSLKSRRSALLEIILPLQVDRVSYLHARQRKLIRVIFFNLRLFYPQIFQSLKAIAQAGQVLALTRCIVDSCETPTEGFGQMLVATFNINGIKARIEALPRWLSAMKPDVVCLQEIKSVDEAFPREMFEDMGYRVETHGQKGFNGVAILSRLPLEDVTRGLPGDEADEQARWIEATVISTRPIRVCGLYLPNGNPAPGPKYDYKLAWMQRMEARVQALLAQEEGFLCAGDYNVIPQAEDAARPEAWTSDALYLPQTREAFRRMLNLGMLDAFRAREQAPGHYSFWDYQANSWERNNGIRIDHLLLSPQAADRLTGAGIDRDVRAGDKPSDHVPVWITLED